MTPRFLLAGGLCAAVFSSAFGAVTVTDISGSHDLYKASKKLASLPSHQACVDAATASGSAAGATFTCRTISTVTVKLVAPPKPANETQQMACPAGSADGSFWLQTRTYVVAPAPIFWKATTWLPVVPPTGSCPPKPPPPEMHSGVHIDLSVPLPVGAPGRGVEMVQSPPGGNLAPGVNGTGDFRTVCEPANYLFDDPIVYPGQPGKAHLHSLFGNTGGNANSTYDSLGQGNSTCRGGTVNQSLYWVSSIVDMATSLPVKDRVALVYYKQGNGDLHPELVQAFPRGLKMIAGDPNATTPTRFGPAGFSCNGFAVASDADEPFVGGNHVIPTSCPTQPDGSHELWRAISFPDCWDGVNLDSPDHKSHMAYWPSPNRNPDGSSRETCPPDHPVKLPQLTIIAITPIPPGADISKWTLSCQMGGARGSCMHGDVFEHWNRNGGPDKTIDRMQQFVDGCLKKTLDCGASLLDANTEILGFDGN